MNTAQAVDPWAWTLSSTLAVIGMCVPLVIALIGWIIALQKAKKDAESAKTRLGEEVEKNKALKRQADALEKQVAILSAHEEIPRWEFEQKKHKSLAYVVTNRNAFHAWDIRIEAEPDISYTLGDLAAGSSTSFDFLETGIFGGVRSDITISWGREEGAEDRSHFKLAMPGRW